MIKSRLIRQGSIILLNTQQICRRFSDEIHKNVEV
jgi:hypothetical protein